MSDELATRLRGFAGLGWSGADVPEFMNAAADHIEQQAARIAELESRNAQLKAWHDAVMAQPSIEVPCDDASFPPTVRVTVRPKPLEVKP